MMFYRTMILSVGVCVGTPAIADCKLIDPLAKDVYLKVQAAYNKGNMAEAEKHAGDFWRVHNLEDCIYTKELGVKLVEVNLPEKKPSNKLPFGKTTTVTNVPRVTAEKF